MELAWTGLDLAFRDEVRAFLAANLTPEIRRAGELMTSVYADHDLSLAWQHILAKQGWAAPSWPVEYGGCAWRPAQRYVFARECAAAGAPPLSPMGIQMVAPAIIRYGSPEQRAFYLPRILSGEHIWCQGFSEPNSGSDLASLQMAAVDDGDAFVCTGAKIWTTHANVANWIFCLVRTSRESRKQDGITFLLIEMGSPGIEVRPLLMSSGEHIQNQVFFDEVRVPKGNVIGRIGEGWTVAKSLLEFERGSAHAPGLQSRMDKLVRDAAKAAGADGLSLIEEPLFAAKVAALQVQLDVLETLEYRILAGGPNGVMLAAPSVLKILGTELAQSISELAFEAAGPQARPYQPHAGVPGGPVPNFLPPPDHYISGETWEALAPLRYLNGRAASIYAGSNEIQRNILAKALLGL